MIHELYNKISELSKSNDIITTDGTNISKDIEELLTHIPKHKTKKPKTTHFNYSERNAYNDGGYRANDDGTIADATITINAHGYATFHYNSRNIKVHRFIAYCKFGDKIYDDGIVVRHVNGIKTDNSLNNLELGTYTDNLNDSHNSNTRKPYIPFTDDELDDIHRLIITGKSLRGISKIYETSPASIKRIKDRTSAREKLSYLRICGEHGNTPI